MVDVEVVRLSAFSMASPNQEVQYNSRTDSESLANTMGA